MEQKHVKTFEGSPEPSDIFEPHRLRVELLSDMDALFAAARRLSATGEYPTGPGELPAEARAEIEKLKGERSVVIVTPGRLLMTTPAPKPGTLPPEAQEAVRRLLPPDPPLDISVISYTYHKALLDKSKAIPFFGFLVGFASAGHSVVVFEGHPSAFESGVRGSDVLLVDSGMLPFLQPDWAAVAFRVMRPGAKILLHQRASYTLVPVVHSDNEQGWRYTEPDGEASYANCLLTLLAKGNQSEARVTSGRALPDLAGFTDDPEDLDWVASMPFKYDRLNADEVIKTLMHFTDLRRYLKKRVFFRTMLALSADELVPVSFTLTLTKDADGRRQLLIER